MIAGLIIGLFVGFILGVGLMCLMSVASGTDERLSLDDPHNPEWAIKYLPPWDETPETLEIYRQAYSAKEEARGKGE